MTSTTFNSQAAPLAYSVDEFAKAANLGKMTIYDAINQGELRARKCGKRTIVLASDGKAYLESLPNYSRESARKCGPKRAASEAA